MECTNTIIDVYNGNITKIIRHDSSQFYKVLLLFLFCLLNSFTAYSQKNIVINGEELNELKINQISGFDLNNPGENFEKLSPLGNPVDSIYKPSFVMPEAIFIYDGLELHYYNISGDFILGNFKILNKNFNVKLGDLSISVGDHFEEILAKKPSLKYEYWPEEFSPKKFGKGYSFLEIKLNPEKYIVAIHFRDQII